jgi:hypothetical protein
MKTRPTTQLARILASAVKKSNFRKVAIEYQILTADRLPNPGMVKQLINGYEPRRPETRARLGLPAVCPQCNRRIPHVHPKPAPVVVEKPFDPTAPRTESVTPDEPVRNPLSGFFRSVITGKIVSAREWFQEKASLT